MKERTRSGHSRTSGAGVSSLERRKAGRQAQAGALTGAAVQLMHKSSFSRHPSLCSSHANVSRELKMQNQGSNPSSIEADDESRTATRQPRRRQASILPVSSLVKQRSQSSSSLCDHTLRQVMTTQEGRSNPRSLALSLSISLFSPSLDRPLIFVFACLLSRSRLPSLLLLLLLLPPPSLSLPTPLASALHSRLSVCTCV